MHTYAQGSRLQALLAPLIIYIYAYIYAHIYQYIHAYLYAGGRQRQALAGVRKALLANSAPRVAIVWISAGTHGALVCT